MSTAATVYCHHLFQDKLLALNFLSGNNIIYHLFEKALMLERKMQRRVVNRNYIKNSEPILRERVFAEVERTWRSG